MGIDGLGTYLRRKFPALFKSVDLNAMRGSRVAFDMHLYVHQLFYRHRADEAMVITSLEKHFSKDLRALDVKPVFVFDGVTKGLKPRAHKKREEDRKRKFGALEEAETSVASAVATTAAVPAPIPDSVSVPDSASVPDSVSVSVSVPVPVPVPALDEMELQRLISRRDRLAVSVQRPSHDLFKRVKTVLGKSWGDGTVVTASDDAERHVAFLCRSGAVDWAVSTDYDTLLFGSPHVVLHFGDREKMAVLYLDEVLAAMKFTYPQLVDFGILCGCDNCGKVEGVGPVRAHKLLLDRASIADMYADVLLPMLEKQGGDAITAFTYGFAQQRFFGTGTPECVSLSTKGMST